jgi:hypothetical protein
MLVLSELSRTSLRWRSPLWYTPESPRDRLPEIIFTKDTSEPFRNSIPGGLILNSVERIPSNMEISLENFLYEARERNLWDEFQGWYEAKNKEDPESYPMTLHDHEWLQTFRDFVEATM